MLAVKLHPSSLTLHPLIGVDKVNRPLGCGFWILWLFLGLFSAEWVLLWLAMQYLPKNWVALGVLSSVVVTIMGGWVAIFVRLQRRR